MKNSINNKDLIFIFFGGTMRGIFGAGVVTSLQEQNVYDRIHSIYAISAGAHDAAYFLARDTKLGSSIYYEDLILKDKFIKNRKSKFLYELFLRLISKKNKVKSLVDIDYLIEVEESNKRLKIEEIYKSSIPFYIRLFNMKEKREEYVNGKTNILEKLHAAAAATPFYNKKIKINGNFYTDGDLLSRIIDKNLEKVIQEHSDKKIFLVFNDSKKDRFSRETYFENFVWAILLFAFLRKTYVFKKLNLAKEKNKLEKICALSNIAIIEPDFDLSVFCEDKEALMKLYQDGIKKTDKIFK